MNVERIPELSDDYVTLFESPFHLERDKTAVIVIDMQYASACRTTGLGRLLEEQGRAESARYRFDRIEQVVVPNIRELITYCRNTGVRVVFVTNGSEMPDFSDLMPAKTLARATNNTRGHREHEILDELKPLPGECVINKLTVSAFNGSNIDHVHRSMGIEYLLFTGVSTNSCVDLTARDAADRGYRCVLIEDCLGAAKEEYHLNTLRDFQRLMGRVDTMQGVIAELEAGIPG